MPDGSPSGWAGVGWGVAWNVPRTVAASPVRPAAKRSLSEEGLPPAPQPHACASWCSVSGKDLE